MHSSLWRSWAAGGLVTSALVMSALTTGGCASESSTSEAPPEETAGAGAQAGKGGAAGKGSAGAGQAGKGGALPSGGQGGSAGAKAGQGGSATGGQPASGQGGSEQGGGEQGGQAQGGGEQGGSAGAGEEAGAAGSTGESGAGGTSAGGMSGGSGQGGAPAGPTCQKLGGDRCGKEQNDCAGLMSFDASDCVSCCKVPKNPVIDSNFADPFIARDGDTYYAFATGGSVLRYSSKDLVKWTKMAPALTASPWKDAQAGFWAPTVYKAKSGKWVLYYAAETNEPGNEQHCIGKAVSNSLDGTFQSTGKPFICKSSRWSIDPSVFEDTDGKDYLLWRQDTADMPSGNAFIRPLDANGDLIGQEHQLVSRANKEPSWEFDSQGGVLENPAMVKHKGVYHLFYSGFRWQTAGYSNGHAICDTPIGPCKKTSTTAPWQGSKGDMKGPGGADVVKAKDGTLFMYMHGWEAPNVGPDNNGQRKLWLYRLLFNGNTPAIAPL